MKIEIRDSNLAARIEKRAETSGTSVEEVLRRLVESQEEQDRWLLEDRDSINVKIRGGIEQLERGEGIPEDELGPCLDKLKTQHE